MRIKQLVVDFDRPLRDVEGLDEYAWVWALVRVHGAPVGRLVLEPTAGVLRAATLRAAIDERLRPAIEAHLLADALAAGPEAVRTVRSCADVAHPPPPARLPLVTVAVCTRDRTERLAACLDALARLDYPHLDLLVVDNAPRDDRTERLVRDRHPDVRYVCEPAPGLDRARNRAWAEARGEIVAYTDDDAVVDPAWVEAGARIFAEDPAVECVTGLVLPYEIECEAHELFERYGGFNRGYAKRWYRALPDERGRTPPWVKGAGAFGTGANMMFRRDVLTLLGGFDPALDVGTPTGGGGDLEMFYRVLATGGTLVYEPAAVVRHCHRETTAQLRAQLAGNGHGLFSFWVRSAVHHPAERGGFARFALWWFGYWNVRRWLRSFVRPHDFPRDLIWAELAASVGALGLYRRALREARAHGWSATVPAASTPLRPRIEKPDATAVITVDVVAPLAPIVACAGYRFTRLHVIAGARPLGVVTLENAGEPISQVRLRHVLADMMARRLEELRSKAPAGTRANDSAARERAWDAPVLAPLLGGERVSPASAAAGGGAATAVPASDASDATASSLRVSIVVATSDRPDDLRRCLEALQRQDAPHALEVVVVDNRPGSGLAPAVVAEFPGVRLVSEPRAGASYARNAGIAACSGDVVATTDDDVVVAPDWVRNLVAPFVRTDVLAVTGLVLPLELETGAQHLFEEYGGLGRGFDRVEVGPEWQRSWRRVAVPTWVLGGTANAAFRRSIFADPAIGPMDETLGPGTPTGVGEDTYVFYRILRAGGTIVYEPAALVWHRHRRTLRDFWRQLYAYSRGHVAYHLVTLRDYGDRRALIRLGVELPWAHASRVAARLLGRTRYSLLNIVIEVAGNVTGPWALRQSRRRVKALGRSSMTPTSGGSEGAPAMRARDGGPPARTDGDGVPPDEAGARAPR